MFDIAGGIILAVLFFREIVAMTLLISFVDFVMDMQSLTKACSVFMICLFLLFFTNSANAEQNQSSSTYLAKTGYSQSKFKADKYECLQAAIAQSRRENNISIQPNFDIMLLDIQNRDSYKQNIMVFFRLF